MRTPCLLEPHSIPQRGAPALYAIWDCRTSAMAEARTKISSLRNATCPESSPETYGEGEDCGAEGQKKRQKRKLAFPMTDAIM